MASPVRTPADDSRPNQEPDNQESAGTPTSAPFTTGKVDGGIKTIPNPNPSQGGFRPILPAANAPAPTPFTSNGGDPGILPSAPSSPPAIAQPIPNPNPSQGGFRPILPAANAPEPTPSTSNGGDPGILTSAPSSPPAIAQTITPSAAPVELVGAFTFPPVTSPGSPTFAPTEQETVPVPTAAIVQEETPAPSAELVEEVHEKQPGPVHEASVEADTTLVKMVGIFDPVRAENTIFSEMEDIMQPYFRAFGGPAQDHFELDVTFYHEYNAMETIDGSITMTTYFDVQVTFELSSTDIDEITSFSKSEATQLVEEFFQGNHLLRLKRRLTQAGVKVTDVDIVDSLPNSPSSGQDEAATGRNKGSAEPVYKTPADEPSKDRIALLAAMASGGLVMLFFASVLLISTHRRARQAIGSVVGHLSVIDDSSSAPSYSDSTFDQSRPLSATDMSAPRIKPSALQERRKREEQEQASQRAFDDFSSSSYGDYDDTERLEDGLVSSGALTCLDTEPQYNVSTDYPEFSMYTHLPPTTKPALPLVYPPSPQWSSTGSEYTSAADSREYAEQRRRWHDQANDLALLALPDHASEAEGSNDESDEIATRDSSGASTTQQSTDSSSSSSSSSTSSSTEEQSQISRPGPEHFMVD